MTHKSAHIYYLILILLGIAGAGIVLYATRQYGGGLTLDSVHYVAVARNILAGNGLVSYDNLPLVVWTPLYPLLLAAAGLVARSDPLTIAHAVNAALFGLNIILAGALFRRQLTSPALALLGAVAVLFSTVMLEISVMTLAETLFVSVTLWFLLSAQSYMAGHGRVALVSLAAATAMIFLARYIGITFVLAGVLIIFVAQRGQWRRFIAHASAYALLALTPIALWVIRNYALSGTLFGPRSYPLYSIPEEIIAALRTIGAWFLPGRYEEYGLIGFAVLMVVCALGARIMLRNRQVSQQQLLSIGAVACTVVVYLALLVVSVSNSTNALISNRYLAPVYVPILLLVLFLIDQSIRWLLRRFSASIAQSLVLGSVAVGLIVFPIRTVVADLAQDKPFGNYAYWYQNADWRDGETLAYAKTHIAPQNAPVYSNGPDLFYLYTNRSANIVPYNPNHTTRQPMIKPQLTPGSFPPEQTAYLIWFDRIDWRYYLHSIEELQQVAKLELLQRLSDGAVYRISRR